MIFVIFKNTILIFNLSYSCSYGHMTFKLMRALHFAATSLIQAGEVCFCKKELLIYSLYICCCIPNTVYFLNPLLTSLLLDVHQVVPLSQRPAVSKASKQFLKILLGFEVVILRYITKEYYYVVVLVTKKSREYCFLLYKSLTLAN